MKIPTPGKFYQLINYFDVSDFIAFPSLKLLLDFESRFGTHGMVGINVNAKTYQYFWKENYNYDLKIVKAYDRMFLINCKPELRVIQIMTPDILGWLDLSYGTMWDLLEECDIIEFE